MAETKIYNVINSSMKGTDNSPFLVGYTISSYEQALSALNKAKKIAAGQDASYYQSDESEDYVDYVDYIRPITTRRNELQGTDDGSGFVVGNYQGIVVFKDYMAFVVEAVDNDGVKQTYLVADSKNSANEQISNGIGCIDSNPIFPASVILEASRYTSLNGEDFKIGIGLDIANFGMKFFQKFFPNIKWDVHKLESLAAQGCLYANIIFPVSDKHGVPLSLTSMVTCNIKDVQGAPFQVHIPTQLLLTKQYSKVGDVYVSYNDKHYVVGADVVTSPFSSSDYDYFTGTLGGFNPSFIEKNCKNNTGMVTYIGSSLCSGNNERKGRVQLFFQPSKKDVVLGVIGAIADENDERYLFDEGLPEWMIEDFDDTSSTVMMEGIRAASGQGSPAKGLISDSCFYYPNQVNWDSKWLKSQKPKVIEYGQLIEDVAKAYNINTRMFLAQICCETGWMTEPVWTASNNPGGLSSFEGYIKKENAKNLGEQFANVIAWADHERLEGDWYYCFFSEIDGLNAKACQVVNNNEFKGINVRGDKTVKDYFYGIQSGSKRYAASKNYSEELKGIYEINLSRP